MSQKSNPNKPLEHLNSLKACFKYTFHNKITKIYLKPGDVVTLKNGSVPMTVEVNYQSRPTMPVDVWCVYHINGTDFVRHQYRLEMLEKKY